MVRRIDELRFQNTNAEIGVVELFVQLLCQMVWIVWTVAFVLKVYVQRGMECVNMGICSEIIDDKTILDNFYLKVMHRPQSTTCWKFLLGID